VIKNRL